MRIHWIRLENFLGFKGSNDILFSHSPDKPITLIEAQNASGKTTLSKALNWLFYSEFKWHVGAKPLPNADIISTDETQASVEVNCGANNSLFTFKRVVSRDGDNKLSAFEVDDKGSHKAIANPEKLVSLIFPYQWAVLHSLDGDEIANLMNGNYKKIIENLITDPNKDTKIKILELSTNKILNEFGGLPFGSGRVRLNNNTFDILEADMVYRPAAGTVFLCGLAFQIAIISTRTKNQIKADVNITDAPIFFDDCFGRLEDRICSNILNYLTQISNQVILLNDKNTLPGLDEIGTSIGTELTFNRTADRISIKNMQITQ